MSKKRLLITTAVNQKAAVHGVADRRIRGGAMRKRHRDTVFSVPQQIAYEDEEWMGMFTQGIHTRDRIKMVGQLWSLLENSTDLQHHLRTVSIAILQKN